MKKNSSLIRDDSGSVSTLTVILLAVFVGLLAYVIDMGHLHTVHNELRNAADACALRGARGFLPDSVPVTGLTPTPMDPDPLNAKTQASLTIGVNRSDNVALTDLPTDEIQVGIWNYEISDWVGGSPVFTWPPDSSLWGRFIGPGISLPTKRDGTHNNGPVGMTLAQIFGTSTVAVTNVRATAALSGVGGFVPGSPALPFGPMKQYLPDPPGPFHGTFRNDNTDTFGWSNLDPNNTNPSASDLKNLLTGKNSVPDCPYMSTVGLNNGQISSALMAMTGQNNPFGLVETPAGSNVYVPTGSNAAGVNYSDMVYMLPVYDKSALSNPDTFNQAGLVGAVPVKLVSVGTPPLDYIDIQILPPDKSYVVPGYGGGAWYGILATEPKLVQ
jgi:hypothetical protein